MTIQIDRELLATYENQSRVEEDMLNFSRELPNFNLQTANMLTQNGKVKVFCLVGRMVYTFQSKKYQVSVGYYLPLSYPVIEPRCVIILEGNEALNTCQLFNEEGIVQDERNWASRMTIIDRYIHVETLINQIPPVISKTPATQTPTAGLSSAFSEIGNTVRAAFQTVTTNLNHAFGMETNLTPQSQPQQTAYPYPSSTVRQPSAEYTNSGPQQSTYVPGSSFQATYIPEQSHSYTQLAYNQTYQIPAENNSRYALYSFEQSSIPIINTYLQSRNEEANRLRAERDYGLEKIEGINGQIAGELQAKGLENQKRIYKGSSIGEILSYLRQNCNINQVQKLNESQKKYMEKIKSLPLDYEQLSNLLDFNDVEQRIALVNQ